MIQLISKKTTNIIGFILCGALSACVGQNSTNPSKPATITSAQLKPALKMVADGALDPIEDFFGETFETWGGSQFLQDIGIQPAGATEVQFDQLENQMSVLSSQIQSLINTSTQIYYSINNMQNYLDNGSFNTLSNEFSQLFNNTSVYYNGFINATMISESPAVFYNFQQITTSANILQNLSSGLDCGSTASGGVSCTGLINAYEDTLNIIGQSSGNITTNTFNTSNFAAQLFQAIQTKSLENFPSAGNQNNYNLSSQITMNNETILAYLSQVSGVLQQDYNMLATMLYVKYNAPESAGFSGLTFPVAGMIDTQSYAYNMQVLNNTYSNYFTQLHNTASQYILSDNPNNPESAGNYKNVKTLSGVSGGTWSQNCNLYVWSGADSESSQGYNGSYNGGQITAQCFSNNQNIGQYSLTMVQQCSDGHDPISFYYGANASNNNVGQLQCQQTMNAPTGPFWNSSSWYGNFGITTAHCSDFGCSNGNIGINAQGFNNYPGTNSWAAIAGVFAVNSGFATWGVDGNNIHGTFASGVFQYITPEGLVDYFAVLLNGNPMGTSESWQMQLQCVNNDQWCSQMGSYENQLNICVGHNQLQLQYQGSNGNGGNAVVSYVGGC